VANENAIIESNWGGRGYSMRTIKENIQKSPELQILLEKSKRRRYICQKKTKQYCDKSIEKREIAL